MGHTGIGVMGADNLVKHKREAPDRGCGCARWLVVGVANNVNTAGKGMAIECHASKAPIHGSVV